MSRLRFRSRPASTPATPPAARGWVARAYGTRADELVDALPALMEAASAEASTAAIAPSTDAEGGRSQKHRGLLWDDLRDLRSAIIEIDVSEGDVDRDRRLRAAVATAIGAASSLALASPSQPTAGYLGLTQTAVDGVLGAAGRRTLA